jgi:hypothetical protein
MKSSHIDTLLDDMELRDILFRLLEVALPILGVFLIPSLAEELNPETARDGFPSHEANNSNFH